MARVKPEQDRLSAVAAYKNVLKRVVDNRPSGTRHRLALALGKNRSFISQLTSPAYSVPIPPAHLETIFQLCHFTPADKSEFLAAYNQAHTQRLGLVRKTTGSTRTLSVTVPDLGSDRRNRMLDEAITEMAHRMGRLAGDKS
jgi:hypothetical protein